MWHTRSGFLRHSFGSKLRTSLAWGITVIALVGFLGAIVVNAVSTADHRSIGGPVISGIGDGHDYAAARRTAESLGFTNVFFRKVDFPEMLGCGAEDSAYYADARDQREQEVHLTICCGGFDSPYRGCSVRTR